MTSPIMKSFTLAMALFVALAAGSVLIFSSTAAEAARCGGLNQKACPVLNKGPQCNKWLRKVKKTCRPCGGLGQKACPALAKGKSCKPGLKWKLGKCVKVTSKSAVKAKLLRDAHNRARSLKPLIRTLGAALKTINNDRTLAEVRDAFKSKRPDRIANVIMKLQSNGTNIALKKAGFRTLTLGISSGVGVGVAYGRETGGSVDIDHGRRAKLYVAKTWSGGVQAGVGNDFVISAYSDANNRINGKTWAAIGNFDAGSGLGIVIYYDKKTLVAKGLSVAIGIGSVGAGGAVGHVDTALCPATACNRVF